jgi:hypothetical protein
MRLYFSKKNGEALTHKEFISRYFPAEFDQSEFNSDGSLKDDPSPVVLDPSPVVPDPSPVVPSPVFLKEDDDIEEVTDQSVPRAPTPLERWMEVFWDLHHIKNDLKKCDQRFRREPCVKKLLKMDFPFEYMMPFSEDQDNCNKIYVGARPVEKMEEYYSIEY